MSSYSAVLVLLCCSFVFTVHAEDKRDVSVCDCGPNSKGCKIVDGNKVCDCEVRYKQVDGRCQAYCWGDYSCNNGGRCVNEQCQCLYGTSGDFCNTVDACEGIKGPIMCGDPQKVLCRYDVETFKPYCMCRLLSSIYNPKDRECVECYCGKFGSCKLVDGKKQCTCNEGAALRQKDTWGEIFDVCIECDCGVNSEGCSFDGYTKVCHCKPGFAQQPDLFGDKCNPCNCGPHGKCFFRGWYQSCTCEDGYEKFLTKDKKKLTCEACDCGKNGECSFVDEVKQCKCNPGYEERDGICTEH